jgi:hypothetical protein
MRGDKLKKHGRDDNSIRRRRCVVCLQKRKTNANMHRSSKHCFRFANLFGKDEDCLTAIRKCRISNVYQYEWKLEDVKMFRWLFARVPSPSGIQFDNICAIFMLVFTDSRRNIFIFAKIKYGICHSNLSGTRLCLEPETY